MDSLSLLELNSLVRRSLEQCLPDEYWIQAELSDVRSNTTGHCYLEFVQKDPRSNNLVAKARGMIWNNIYRLLKPYFEESTGQLFTSGIKVLVKVTVQFHELYGYSLTATRWGRTGISSSLFNVKTPSSSNCNNISRRRRAISPNV